jgi:hypothetical protein
VNNAVKVLEGKYEKSKLRETGTSNPFLKMLLEEEKNGKHH